MDTAIADLENLLTKTTTAEIESVIKDLILEYWENQAPTTNKNESIELQQTKNRQRMIGLHPFLCGLGQTTNHQVHKVHNHTKHT